MSLGSLCFYAIAPKVFRVDRVLTEQETLIVIFRSSLQSPANRWQHRNRFYLEHEPHGFFVSWQLCWVPSFTFEHVFGRQKPCLTRGELAILLTIGICENPLLISVNFQGERVWQSWIRIKKKDDYLWLLFDTLNLSMENESNLAAKNETIGQKRKQWKQIRVYSTIKINSLCKKCMRPSSSFLGAWRLPSIEPRLSPEKFSKVQKWHHQRRVQNRIAKDRRDFLEKSEPDFDGSWMGNFEKPKTRCWWWPVNRKSNDAESNNNIWKPFS